MNKRIACVLAALITLGALGVPVSAYNPGDKVGTYAYTDIVAYIDGAPIESYNINWETAVVVEDLKNYGFEVIWDQTPGSRNLRVTRSSRPISSTYIPPARKHKNGDYAGDVLYTDIVTYFNGTKVDSFNINGRTIVYVNDIARFYGQPGTYKYNDSTRSLSLSLSGAPAAVPTPTPTQPKALRISSQPKSASAAVGSTVRFSITASGGTSPYTYTWERRGPFDMLWTPVLISSGTSSYSFPATQDILYGGYIYRCTVTDASGQSVISDTVALMPSASPLTASVKADKTSVSYGGSAKITASVSGGVSPYTYTWYKYNSSKQTWEKQTSSKSNTYSVSNLTSTAYIRCEIKDAAGSVVTTDHVTISVAASALKVSLSADRTTVSYNGTAKVTANVQGGISPYTYSWYKYNSSKQTWEKQSSATKQTCTVSNIKSTVYIRCEVKDSSGSVVTSDHVTLSVSVPAMSATLSADRTTVQYGGTAKVTANVIGGASPYTFSWYKYNSSKQTWEKQSSAVNQTCTVSNIKSTIYIRCEVKDAAGTVVTTDHVTLTVAPSIMNVTLSADRTTVAYGGTAKVTANVQGGVSPYTFSWYKYDSSSQTWVKQSAAVNQTCTVSNIKSTIYLRCEVRDASGSVVTSDHVTLSVSMPAMSAVLSADKTSLSYGSGTAKLSASVSGGSAPYIYTWYIYDNLSGRWINQGYNTIGSYVLNDLTSSVTMRCEITDASGASVTTNSVTVSVAAASVTAVLASDSPSVQNGGSAKLSVAAQGGRAPYIYKWSANSGYGWQDLGYSTANSYVLTDIRNNTQVRVEVTDADGYTGVSNTVTIICSPYIPSPTPDPTPGVQTDTAVLSADRYSVSSGGTVVFSVNTDLDPVYYMWYVQYEGSSVLENPVITVMNTCPMVFTKNARVYCTVAGYGGMVATSNIVDITVS